MNKVNEHLEEGEQANPGPPEAAEVAQPSGSSVDGGLLDPSASGQDPQEDDELAEIERLIGTDFDGRYRIIAELARGGMGIVFRAEHLTLNRPVVIKVLKANQVGSSSAKARFEREARRACQLDHPNIVTVHDFGYHDDLGYLVMEFVDGITLYDYVRKYGPLSFQQFAPVTAAILSGLAEAHKQGIVHRDIKASNIMMTFDDDKKLRRVKILDFGLAKAEGAAEDNVTRQSALVGTMGAMPPERILCKPTDCRVDLYALGICTYRLVAGRRPFVGEDMHVLYQHVHEHPAPLTERLPDAHDYPIMVLEWIHRLLAKEPADRPRDGSQAREWLLETVSDSSVFRIEESGAVPWMEAAKNLPPDHASKSGTFEVTDPSWSITSSPSGSFRSVISPDSVKRAVEQMHAEHEAAEEPPEPTDNKKPLIIGASVVGVIALVAIVSAVAFSGGSDDGATVTPPDATQTSGAVVEQTDPTPSNDNVDEVFKRIESSLEKGSYATAENLLQSIQDRLGSNTDLQVKAAEFQARIDIDKHLRKARQAEGELDIEEAIASYDAALSLDANNSEAKERHDDLGSKIVLKVSSDPRGAGVYVDGKRLGDTPIEKMIDLNFSKVEVRKPQYDTWSASLVPKGGTAVELVAQLDKRKKRNGTSPTGKKEDDGLGNESLMGMGN